jgi:NAD(P)-dependent dehydrogenase (short-subunit alcohol dehydrogenase family)
MATKCPSLRNAIITGAGSGIGAAIARRLAADGWHVLLAGRRPEPLRQVVADIEKSGGSAQAVPCDVTVGSEVARLVAAAPAALDALIHCAGFGQCKSIDELDEAEWRACLDIAVTAAFLTAKAALPKLRAGRNGAGHIIQVASVASGGTWNMEIGYGTAKGAQLKFHLHLANQLEQETSKGGRRIHSHCICPGSVATPFWQRIPEREIHPNDCLTADEVAWAVAAVIEEPTITAEALAERAPRPEVVVKRLPPFECWDNVIAILHASHP